MPTAARFLEEGLSWITFQAMRLMNGASQTKSGLLAETFFEIDTDVESPFCSDDGQNIPFECLVDIGALPALEGALLHRRWDSRWPVNYSIERHGRALCAQVESVLSSGWSLEFRGESPDTGG